MYRYKIIEVILFYIYRHSYKYVNCFPYICFTKEIKRINSHKNCIICNYNVFYLECQVEETVLPVNHERSAVSPTTVLPPAKRPKLCLPPVYKYSASPISSPQVRKPGELVTVREDRGSGSTSETNQGRICEI